MHNIANQLEVIPGRRKDYAVLAQYCHLSDTPPPTLAVWKLVPRPLLAAHYPPIIGIILYSTPLRFLTPRDRATNDYFKNIIDQTKRLRELNTYVAYVARIVVDNRYLRLGLARWLLTYSLERIGTPIVECLCPHDFRVPLFCSLGFTHHLNPPPRHIRQFKHALQKTNIHPALWKHPQLVHQRIDRLPDKLKRFAVNQFYDFFSRYRSKLPNLHGLQRTDYCMAKLDYPTAYLIRIHADHPIAARVTAESDRTKHQMDHSTGSLHSSNAPQNRSVKADLPG